MNAADRIYKLLFQAGPLASKEIQAVLNLPKQTVDTALALLEKGARAQVYPPDEAKTRNRRWTLTVGTEIRPKLDRNKTEVKTEVSVLGLSCQGEAPQTPQRPRRPKTDEPEPRIWRRSDVVGRDGARMWIDPDGCHVSVRSMTAELRSYLGITDAVPLPKETQNLQSVKDDPYIPADGLKRRLAQLQEDIKANHARKRQEIDG